MAIKVFVTYSWDSEEHKIEVSKFTNELRTRGYHAVNDIILTQSETSLDFKKMMHQGMTDYQKVIVVLSSGYKKKAEEFSNGVGAEYELIIKDIKENPNKYILVTFEKVSNSIAPLMFKDRHTLEIPREFNVLDSKLQDSKLYHFSEVANELVNVEKQTNFETNNSIEIVSLNQKFESTSQIYNLYTRYSFELSVLIKNNSLSKISGFALEVLNPKGMDKDFTDGNIQENHYVRSIDYSDVIFSKQSKSVSIGKFSITNKNIESIIDSTFVIRIFSDFGTIEKEFKVNDTILVEFDNHLVPIERRFFNDRNV